MMAPGLAHALIDLSKDFNRGSLTLSIMQFPDQLDGMLTSRVWSPADFALIKRALNHLNCYSIDIPLRLKLLKIAIDARRVVHVPRQVHAPGILFLHTMIDKYLDLLHPGP